MDCTTNTGQFWLVLSGLFVTTRYWFSYEHVVVDDEFAALRLFDDTQPVEAKA
ncbi:hypothetical protein HUZ36_10750 [Pseudoalteromonas sp. McH1-7]|uniref:hypothetical protein n=1 Tax=Pseudoalteromonas TaxID=53246 RepID=UPI001169F3C4|nr:MULTISPECIES: hypothetical protein [Pseudoalteromonas]MDW7547684.1 hypothetical protein [Pseudoalteromonas peptidolytica]NUZ11261.1 hypothetical protein [Pseudoalteromonas sp. McH1-7]USD27691.1 hypothetical protein J8Z24_12110 [Pseudoalteromonas sp. SCSIO 43201]GEK09332.1 hypothetical protein PPE03_15810 [Pseudoalteromonas peptidolytica]